MKMSLMLLVGMVFGLSAQATPTIQNLVCGNGPAYTGFIHAVLDSSAFDRGSGLKNVTGANLMYEYSSISRMVCEGFVDHDSYDVDCVGLYAGGREPMVMKLRTENGKIVAHWNTSQPYGHKAMASECLLK